jgi:hypothetical protein
MMSLIDKPADEAHSCPVLVSILRAIGAVDVSFIVSALEVTFPVQWHPTIPTLFSIEHLPLLATSVLPALLIYTFDQVDFFIKKLNQSSVIFTVHPDLLAW